ncbi:MAG: glycoside hydrolase family 15 protein [Vicinamibacterales bacterium]
MRLESLSLVGNCQFSALVGDDGDVPWCCLPRFDAEPIFGRLLDPDGGGFRIAPASGERGTQRYLENTNILETRFETPDGAFRLVDFAPRFRQFDRVFRPTQLVRIVEPLSGTPRITATCDPRLGFSKAEPARLWGSHHASFQGFPTEVRLTTDAPLAYLQAGTPFALTQTRRFVLTWGRPIEEPLAPLCDRFLRETESYWRRWVKHCAVPPEFQREVIRSALVLKLHCFEDTGAILASTTTSLPEWPGRGRTWDYRYCWLRDAYYALNAFRLLGHFDEREQFVDYLLNVSSSSPSLDLAPLYGVDGRVDLDERALPDWQGYEGEGPVRVGNGAARQVQHDVYGEMALALAPVFLDERFGRERTRSSLELLLALGRKAMAVAGQPDAGIWELRTDATPQTFSSLMCWAGVDRVARVAERHAPGAHDEFRRGANTIRELIATKAWSDRLCAFASTFGGDQVDASILQAVTLRFLPPEDPRIVSTVDAVCRELDHHGWLRRYGTDDGFGAPEVAFVICTYWLIESLARIGRRRDARALLAHTLEALSPTGLLAEDWDPTDKRLWGNYPQAYSHVGLIHAAFAASPTWAEVE